MHFCDVFFFLFPQQITETYAFLPREAVTRFLTICPECKKNLRPSSPTAGGKDAELAGNESSSEVENYLNYSSHTESSLEAGPTAKRRRHSSADLKASLAVASGLAGGVGVGVGVGSGVCAGASGSSAAQQQDAPGAAPPPSPGPSLNPTATATVAAVESTPDSVPKIRVKSQLQRPLSPPDHILAQVEASPNTAPLSQASPSSQGFDAHLLKSRDNLLRYYDFMRRFYAGEPVLAPPLYGSSLLQSLSYPTPISATAAPTLSSTTSSQGRPLDPLKAASPAPNTNTNPSQLKDSPDTSVQARSPAQISTATPTAGKDTAPLTPINLTKSLFCSLKSGSQASTSTPVAAHVPLKLELPSPPKPLTEMRIPQLRHLPPVELSLPLPPLDLERLKPITSTYLQLTRSMGLSDEDALRFDNLVSKDFKYSL